MSKANDIDNQVFNCSICRQPVQGYGNNAEPVNHGRCCNECNSRVVIPARIQRMNAALDAKQAPRRRPMQ